MNELFQIQPQWARARCLRSSPLAIGVEMPDRPIRAERPFTPLLLLLAIAYLMAVLTPTSASAARLDSAEALAAWAKSKNWTKTSYGIGYESDNVGSFDIWLVYDRTQTLIPFNRSYKSAGREPRSVTDIGENITIAGGIPATRHYLLNVHEPSGNEIEVWEYYCHDYRVLMRAHRDTQIGQVGSDPLALLLDYIAFVNKYLNVKPPKSDSKSPCDGLKKRLSNYIVAGNITLKSISDLKKQIDVLSGHSVYSTGYFQEYQNTRLGNDPNWDKKSSDILQSAAGGAPSLGYLYNKSAWIIHLNKQIQAQTQNLRKNDSEIDRVRHEMQQLGFK